MSNLPIALIEIATTQDINILLYDDLTIKNIRRAVDVFNEKLSANPDSLDDLLEEWGFWVSEENKPQLRQEIADLNYSKSLSTIS